MTATAAQIAEVRRLVNEPTETTYSDTLIQSFIERYPLVDECGTEPYYYDPITTPPTLTANEDWVATYDLYAAAGDIWDEKAASLVDQFDFEADGGNFKASQKYAMYCNAAARCRAKQAIRVHTLHKWPPEHPRTIHA